MVMNYFIDKLIEELKNGKELIKKDDIIKKLKDLKKPRGYHNVEEYYREDKEKEQ